MTRTKPLAWDLVIGAGAGIAANVVTGIVDRRLDRLVSPEQKARERRVRRHSGHAEAEARVVRLVGGRRPGPIARRAGAALFGLAFGLGWGLIHAAVRRRAPATGRLAGLPFAVPFFLACDGLIAPLARLTPGLPEIPWQLNAKELMNHVAWTATAETAHRVADRILDLPGPR